MKRPSRVDPAKNELGVQPQSSSVSNTGLHAAPPCVFTIGHSTRPLDDFIDLLQTHGVTFIVDVRKLPRSRANPQYNRETLPIALAEAGVGYLHLAGLGGLRRPHLDSPNGGWRNPSFRGYADYMQTPEFEESLRIVLDLACRERLTLMCAEAVPWRCHRSLIADALVVRGITVKDILSDARCQVHVLRPWARVCGTQISYPPERLEESTASSTKSS